MWQGANRIHADVVDVDRNPDPQKRTLVADGHVVTNLWEEPKDDKPKGDKNAEKKKVANPVLTEVHSAHMVYTEASRLTHYTGGVQLSRPGLQVKGQELRAFLGEAGADSRLDKAFADGAVEIFSTGEGPHPHRHRRSRRVLHRRSEGDSPRLLGAHGGEAVQQFAAQYHGRQGGRLLPQR